MRSLFAVFVVFGAWAVAQAHHNTQTEFGPFGSDTIYFEAEIAEVNWGNPHVTIGVVVTGGALPAGDRVRLVSHPVNFSADHGFVAGDFAVGDTMRVHGWKHLRNLPLVWMRSLQVNDGPMRSIMRFTDMIDISRGVFEEMDTVPAANLAGSPVGRAGSEAVAILRDMGLVDAGGRMIWPPP